jgi:PAS domain S-box-containing protein
MQRSFLRKRLFVTLLFCFSILLLLAIGFSSYRNTRAWTANRDEVMQVREEILNYEKLLSALKDAETGQRGYLLTGDSLFLEPYLYASDSIRAILSRLDAIPDQDHLTQQTKARIKNLIGRRQDVLGANLRRFAEGRRANPGAIGQSLTFGRGKGLMDSLRLEIKQLQLYKHQLLQLKTADLFRDSNRVMRAQVGGTLAGILLLTWAFVLLRQEMHKRQRNLDALEAANNTLEGRVQERTNELHAALEELNASNEELMAGNEELLVSNEQQAVLLDQLNAARGRQNVAFRISHMGAWEWDLRTNKLRWDENLEAVYGLERGQFERDYGANLDGLQRLVHPDDLDVLMTTVTRAIGAREPFQVEYRIVKPDGTTSWLLGQGTLVTDAQSEPVSVTGIDMDITERKLNEEKIRESEERFRTLADTAPVLIWMADENAAGVYFNQPWLDFTGRPLDRERGGGWAEGVHPEDLPRRLEVFTTALRDRKSFKMEYRLRRHDGSFCWMLDHGVPRFLPDGTFVGYLGSCVNIHDRVEAEAKLKRLFDSGMLGVIEFSFESGITAANDQFLHLIGYSREDMDGGASTGPALPRPSTGTSTNCRAGNSRNGRGGAVRERNRPQGRLPGVDHGGRGRCSKRSSTRALPSYSTPPPASGPAAAPPERRTLPGGHRKLAHPGVQLRRRPALHVGVQQRRHGPPGRRGAGGQDRPGGDAAPRRGPADDGPQTAGDPRRRRPQGRSAGTVDGPAAQLHPHDGTPARRGRHGDRLTCATFDITERKAAEERIRESEAKLRRLFDSGITGIVFWNRQG